MSPEQWGAAGGVVDHQTDLWAVGIILFEMVAGHHPLAPRAGWDLMLTGVILVAAVLTQRRRRF